MRGAGSPAPPLLLQPEIARRRDQAWIENNVMAGLNKRTAWNAMRKPLVALLAVLCLAGGGLWVAVAFGCFDPPAPTITANPGTSPTNSTSISFKYVLSGTASFQCARDGAAPAACPNAGVSYSGLAEGSHSFRVVALDNKGKSRGEATYAWVIDRTPPTVSSISRADANPTKANPLHWTVTFSKPVKNVAAANFGLVTNGLGGTAPTITSVTRVGSVPTTTWTVTVATAGTTGTNSGSIGLNLTSKGSSPNQIQDAAGNVLGGSVPVVGQAYTFDKLAPTVLSITRLNASPTNASSVSWTVTFSESVAGVAKGNFSLAQSGLTGSPAVTGVSGSGSTWTVSASTGSSTPSNGSAGSLQLNLSKTSGIADLAGNALAGTFNGTAAVYQIDKLTPAPVFTSKPPNPSYTATTTFAWTEQEAGDTFLCSEENGPFNIPCSSPFTYVVGTTNNGIHQFAVKAIDSLGNVSSAVSYTWKVEKGSIQDFTISGNLAGLLYPAGQARSVAITLTNPNNLPIYVTSLTVNISGGLPNGCLASWFQVTQSNVSSANAVMVPANSSVTLPHANSTNNGTVSAPTIQMTDSGNQQDACKNATFNLSYSGSSHS
jgi:hypothetical protein